MSSFRSVFFLALFTVQQTHAEETGGGAIARRRTYELFPTQGAKIVKVEPFITPVLPAPPDCRDGTYAYYDAPPQRWECVPCDKSCTTCTSGDSCGGPTNAPTTAPTTAPTACSETRQQYNENCCDVE